MKPRSLCALLALLLFGACTTTPERGTLQHVVLVWLKPDAGPDAVQRITEVSESFRSIPGVLDVRIGTSVPSERPEVEDSFDVGLVLTFTDVAAMTAYLTHPDHLRAVDEVLLPAAARVQVYDLDEG